MSDRHTIMIPTLNRPALVQRLARFYRKAAPWADLLILDSSKPETIDANAKALASLGGAVRHVVFSGTLQPLTKIMRGLELTQTTYVAVCADDDIVLPERLLDCIGFLKTHPDYAVAHGLYLNFRPEGSAVHLFSEYSGPGNEAGHPGARIFRLLQRYESLLYGAYRTTELRTIYAAAQKLPTDLFIELFQSVATVIMGKVKRFPSFYAARQSGPPAEPARSTRNRWQTHYWFAENPGELLEHYARYCDEVWMFYEANASAPRLEKAAFERALHLAHAVYFSAGCPPEYFHSALQIYWPQDSYLDARQIDLLARLAPTRGRGHALAQLWQRVARKAQNVSLGFGLGSLDRAAAQTGATPWQCRLPLKLHWLAHNADFRASWLELCRYLDS
jgi:glycosyltransferase domain-containing protein